MLTVEKVKEHTRKEIHEIGHRICPEIGVKVDHARRAYRCDCSTCRQAARDMERAEDKYRKAQSVQRDVRGDWDAARSRRVNVEGWRGGVELARKTGGRFRSRDALEVARERYREVAGPDPGAITWAEYLDRCLRRAGIEGGG